MSEKNNGGPAFPVSNAMALEPDTAEEFNRLSSGMTMRDYFAAKAMQSFLLWADAPETPGGEIAKSAYLMADKMLEERTK